MPVICEHCKQPIESKDDLIVMRQWWFLTKPLHKKCWGDLAMGHGGIGSVSYQTGMLQGRKQTHIAINSALYTIIAIISLILAIVILFLDFSSATMSSGGVTTKVSPEVQILLKGVFFLILLIAPMQRFWSYTKYESQLQKKAVIQ